MRWNGLSAREPALDGYGPSLGREGPQRGYGLNNYFSHDSQDGTSFAQRIANAGYSGGFPRGENIAAGHSSPSSAVNGWMASTSHCTNIMKAGYGDIGVGYAFVSGSTYGHYWTQDFGGG